MNGRVLGIGLFFVFCLLWWVQASVGSAPIQPATTPAHQGGRASPEVQATATQGPSPRDVEIVSWQTERDINGTLWVVGEVRNKAQVALRPQMQAVSRDKAGTVIDTEDWAASGSNLIPPGGTWPIKFPISRKAEVDTVTLRVMSVRAQ